MPSRRQCSVAFIVHWRFNGGSTSPRNVAARVEPTVAGRGHGVRIAPAARLALSFDLPVGTGLVTQTVFVGEVL